MRKLRFVIIYIILAVTITCAHRRSGVHLSDSARDKDEVPIGDMILTKGQLHYLYSKRRVGLRDPTKKWPNATVYFEFGNSINHALKKDVTKAMTYIQGRSCVQFIRQEHPKSYILIEKGTACSSKVGMLKRGAQSLAVGRCTSTGNIVHELLHALGFLHMHTARRRDRYVKINWNNIQNHAKLNFEEIKAPVEMYDTEYDYGSIMHYSEHAFAKNKSIKTIIPKHQASQMGQRKEMSWGDVKRLNRMYNCPGFEDDDDVLSESEFGSLESDFNLRRSQFSPAKMSEIAHSPPLATHEIDSKKSQSNENTEPNVNDNDSNMQAIESIPKTLSDGNNVDQSTDNERDESSLNDDEAVTKNNDKTTAKNIDKNDSQNDENSSQNDENVPKNIDKGLSQNDENVPKNNEEATENDDTEVQDDMRLSKEQFEALFSKKANARNGLASAFHHWPEGAVPVEFDTEKLSSDYINDIVVAMEYIMQRSCIRFHPRKEESVNYVFITTGTGCSSEVGAKNAGKQEVNLNPSLCTRGKIVHELLHVLGFLHMHTANERDNYIKVNWDNISKKQWVNFKQFNAHVSMFKTPYDYNSIMHYSQNAFAIDKFKPTMEPVFAAPYMGQRDAMSTGDILRLNRMYKCPILESYFAPPIISSTPDTSITDPANNPQDNIALENYLQASSVPKSATNYPVYYHPT